MKKITKRILTLTLVALMLTILPFATAFAAEELNCELGLFRYDKGRIDQWRIGLNTSNGIDATTIGGRVALPDGIEDKFIKNASLSFDLKEKSEVPGHIYDATLYTMTTEWPEEQEGYNAQGKFNPWLKDTSEYDCYPNLNKLTEVADAQLPAVGNNRDIKFVFDITKDLNERSLDSKTLAYVYTLKRPENAVSWDEKYCVYVNSNNLSKDSNYIKLSIEYYETEEEIEEALKDMTSKTVKKYIKYFYPDSAYFELPDTAEIDEAISNAAPKTKAALLEILNSEIAKIQVETTPADGAKEISLKMNQITVNVSKNGENKQPAADGIFTLKDSTDTEVNITFENGVVRINEDLKDEENYTFSWTGITDITDGSISFKTTGTYTYLDTSLSENSVKIGEEITVSAKGVFEKSKNVNEISMDKITVSDYDDTVFLYADGKLTALKRGVSDVKFTFENETGGEIESNAKAFSYNKKSDSESSDFEVEYITLNIAASENTAFTISDTAITVNDAFSHQIVIDLTGDKGILYFDGTKMAEAEKNVLKNLTFPETITVSDKEFLNVSGEECYVDFVTARNVDGKLIGSYTYYDNDNDDNYGTEVKWLYSLSKSGSYTEFSTDKELTLPEKVKGKYVVFEVTPKNIYETGKTVTSDPIYIKDSVSTPDRGSSVTVSAGIGTTINNEPVEKPDTTPETIPAFSDVPESHWAYSYITELASKNILKGMSENIYAPENNVTRAEFACAIVKALNLSTGLHSGKFSDVREDDWYMPYVEAAYANGIVSGFDNGTFRPDEFITREQICVMAANALKLTETTQITFSDASEISSWAEEAVSKMVKSGIISGRDNNMFVPKSNATRAEMAKITALMLKEVK